MKLLLDVGNTRIKWALLPQRARWADGAVRTGVLEEGEERLPELEGPPEAIHGVYVTSEEARQRLDEQCAARWGLRPQWLRSARAACGVRTHYHDPDQLGADRWAALIAARQGAPGEAVCVVDAGTAVTVDALDAHGAHLGGAILPGRRLMASRLDGGTGRVRPGPPSETPELPARSTEEGVWAAIQHGLPAAVGALTRGMFPPDVPVRGWVTGGDGAWLVTGLRTVHPEAQWELRPYTVLEGVAAVALWPGKG